MVKNMRRLLKHLLTPGWWARRTFNAGALDRLEQAIRDSEPQHGAELRLAIEGELDLHELLRGVTPRQRAIELFSRLRVWDTEENNGVLIYVQCVDRTLEIVADRGVAAKVDAQQWRDVCAQMGVAFQAGKHEEGVLQGIAEVSALLMRHYPRRDGYGNELPDRPVVL
jgi:uncharacterized membrane protein YgcG